MYEYWCVQCKSEKFESTDLGETQHCNCGGTMHLMLEASDIGLTPCNPCSGSGANVYTDNDCEYCAGTGFQPQPNKEVLK